MRLFMAMQTNPRGSSLALHITGKHIWLAAPPLLVKRSIKHYLTCKAAAPETTSACVAVPQLKGATWAAFA